MKKDSIELLTKIQKWGTDSGYLFYISCALVIAAACAWIAYIEYGYKSWLEQERAEQLVLWESLSRAYYFDQWSCEATSFSSDALLRKVNTQQSAISSEYAPDDLVSIAYQYTHPNLGRQEVRAIVREPLEQMIRAAWQDGHYLLVNSSYRSYDAQYTLYQQYSARSNASGMERAALPGFSEHQLGTAVDISQYPSAAQAGYDWLAEHAYEYGFVLSYPDGVQEVTQYRYEPWHWRYVGTEIASYIHENHTLYNHEQALLLPSPREDGEELSYEYEGRDLWVWKYRGGSAPLEVLISGVAQPDFYKDIVALLNQFEGGIPAVNMQGDFLRNWVVNHSGEYTDAEGDSWQVTQLASFYRKTPIEYLQVMYRPEWGYLVASYQTQEASKRLTEEFTQSCRVE